MIHVARARFSLRAVAPRSAGRLRAHRSRDRAIRRRRRSATGASTTITPSYADGIGRLRRAAECRRSTIGSPRARAASSSARRRASTAGCTIASSRRRASGLGENAAAQRRAIEFAVMRRGRRGPNAATMASKTGSPGRCSSRTSASASITVAPHSRKSAPTVDFPAATDPVSATTAHQSSATWSSSWRGMRKQRRQRAS